MSEVPTSAVAKAAIVNKLKQVPWYSCIHVGHLLCHLPKNVTMQARIRCTTLQSCSSAAIDVNYR